MQRHRRSIPSMSNVTRLDGRDDEEQVSLLGSIRRSPLRVIHPRRAVETEPLSLLSDDTMAALYDEQLRKASKLTKTKTTHGRLNHPRSSSSTHKYRRDYLEPHYERRSSVGSSRPRTSTSSSLAPPTPQEAALNAAAIAHLFDHSIVLESAAMQASAQRDCQVCYERMDASDTQSCDTCHGAFCAACVRRYMEYKILEGEVSEKKLVCPAPQCMRPLTEDYIQKHVSPETYAKYDQYRENQRPGVRFCPRPGCCTKIEEPRFTTSRRAWCASCGHEACMKCGNDFHVFPTCRRKEKRYDKWRNRSNVHKCPSCKTDIEKQGGCAHMRCFQCDAEFCWLCLRPWDTHDETLCVPLSFLRSKDPTFGNCKPVRAVTKTVAVGAAVVVGATGVGVAVVVLPPLLLVHWIRTSVRFHRRKSFHSDADAFTIE